MILDECPDLYSFVQMDPDHQMNSLILLKSIAHHFSDISIDEIECFNEFLDFFLQTAIQLFIDSQSYSEISIIFISLYYLINKIDQNSISSDVLIEIISKFNFLSEFQNDEEYQQCLKNASKTIHLLFVKSFIPNDISPDLLISTFNIAFQLFIEDLKPNTRNHLTKLICKLLDYQIVTKFFFRDIENFIESKILPFFISTEITCELYDQIDDLYDPYNSSIYFIQFLSICKPDFMMFLNSYLIQFIQHIIDSNNQSNLEDEIMNLFAYTKLAASTLQLSEESLLQPLFFESRNEILRLIAFTISANFKGVLPSDLFYVCLDHLNDEINSICQLAAVSAIKCLENEDFNFDGEEVNFLPQLFEAYLTITENPDLISISTLKLLKKLLNISGSPGEYSNPILSSLMSRLINLLDENGDLFEKIVKRISQILVLNSANPDLNDETDSFITELISIFGDFTDFFKEKILLIFETSAEFCFSEEVSWNIINIFDFGNIIFQDEMMVLRKLLISAKINSIIDMDAIQFLMEKLFEKIENDSFDDETALNSLSDIISSLFGIDDENVDACIYQEIVPLVLERIQEDVSASAVSRLISCIFIFSEKNEKEFDYQPFIDFWIANAEYPYYCASAISIIQSFISDTDICLNILLKICDELSEFYLEIKNQQFFDEFEFPEFTLRSIIADLLKLIKFLKEEIHDFYILFHQEAKIFIDETLPQIVDYICFEK